MTEVNNVDALLVQEMQKQATPSQTVEVSNPTPPAEPEKPAEEPKADVELKAPDEGNVPHETVEETKSTEKVEKNTETKEAPIDEYGNPIAKPKMYSEEDVQKMIRDRLSRVKQDSPQQPPRQETQSQPQEEASDNWEAELENFIDRTLDKKQKKYQEEQWKAQELKRQADFEDKFNQGMTKYTDFRDVVSKSAEHITNSIMLATRSLENPAAFVYGAAKMHPQELERISRIADPYQQATEVGRLHERMVKERAALSKAPPPVEAPKGDMPQAVHKMPSLEERIVQYAKQKRK